MEVPEGRPLAEAICSKGYPKAFCDTTHDSEGYPIYRRRDDKRFHTVTVGDRTFDLDNRWVVPYNPALCLKYQVRDSSGEDA